MLSTLYGNMNIVISQKKKHTVIMFNVMRTNDSHIYILVCVFGGGSSYQLEKLYYLGLLFVSIHKEAINVPLHPTPPFHLPTSGISGTYNVPYHNHLPSTPKPPSPHTPTHSHCYNYDIINIFLH